MLPPFVSIKENEKEKEKPKIDRLSKKKRMKKSATVSKDLKDFRFVGK
jgi:hypothetical protein